MTGREVGRNEPCPCGSGKKYKHCCLREDQRRRQRGAEASSTGSPIDRRLEGLLEEMRFLTRQLDGASGEKVRALRERGEWLECMAAELMAEQRIDAAMEMLEERRDVFEAMAADPPELMGRAMHLFSDELFSNFRISLDALEQAFDAVGYPRSSYQGFSDQDIEILKAAAIHLAGDDGARADIAWSLLALLPELVDAGRFQDGWLVQHSAHCLVEVPDRTNPLMFVMVQLAYEAWQRDLQRKRESLLVGLGVDLSGVHSAGRDEVLALIREVERDPDKLASVERFYAEHAAVKRSAENWMIEVGSDVLKLLGRDDARELLLSFEDIEPWLIDFVERMESAHERLGKLSGAGGRADSEMLEVARESIRAVAREMTACVFSPELVHELAGALEEYNGRLEDAGEDEAARWARNASAVVALDLPLAENPVLLAISYGSLRKALCPSPGDAAAHGDA